MLINLDFQSWEKDKFRRSRDNVCVKCKEVIDKEEKSIMQQIT